MSTTINLAYLKRNLLDVFRDVAEGKGDVVVLKKDKPWIILRLPKDGEVFPNDQTAMHKDWWKVARDLFSTGWPTRAALENGKTVVVLDTSQPKTEVVIKSGDGKPVMIIEPAPNLFNQRSP